MNNKKDDLYNYVDSFSTSSITGTVSISLNLPSCVICKHVIHPINVDHPFCYNNLEFLEWKARE